MNKINKLKKDQLKVYVHNIKNIPLDNNELSSMYEIPKIWIHREFIRYFNVVEGMLKGVEYRKIENKNHLNNEIKSEWINLFKIYLLNFIEKECPDQKEVFLIKMDEIYSFFKEKKYDR